MIVQPLDALKDRLRESRLFSDEKLESVCAGPKWAAAQDIPQALRALVATKALTPWQAQMLYAGKTTLRFGNYVLLDRLSQDPQNRTFLAEHDSMGRRVALKQLSRQHTQNERTSQTFLAKVRAFSAVNHPRLVHLFDVSQEHDRFYLVKELVEGDNLAALVAASGVPAADRACRWIVEMAEGMDAMHAAGIAHLDLHPGSVVVQKDQSIKILEPGVYEAGQDPAHAAYLAPEVVSDEGAPSADYFSFGMLAHYLLTGKHRAAEGGRSPLFEAEIAAMTSQDVAARKPAYAKLVAAAKSKAEAPAGAAVVAGHYAVEEEIVEAEAVDSIIDVPQTQWDEGDPLGAPPPMAGDDDFFANLDAAAAMATTAQAVLQPMPGTAAYAAAGFAPSAGATGSFPAISLADSGPGKSVGRSAPAPKKSDDDASEKKPSIGILVGLAAGGGALAVLLLVAIGVIVYLVAFSGPEVQQVAKGPGGAAAAVTQTKGPGTPKAGPSSKAATAPGATPDAAEIAVAPEGPAEAAAPEAEDEEEVTPPLGFTFGVEGENPAAPAPTADAPATTAVTTPAPADAAATTPAPTNPPTAPLAEAVAAAPTAPAPPVEPPANPPVPAPAPEPVNALQNPFAAVPDQVDLPIGIGAEADLNPRTLGQVNLNSGDLFMVELEGGAQALKGNQKFNIAPARGGLVPNEWEIYFEGSAALKDDNLIAGLKLEQTEFQFHWTPRAEQDPNSAFLKNCSLALRTGTHAKIIDLRKPLEMPAAEIREMAPVKITVPLTEVPDPESLTLKILGLSVPFDYDIPNATLKANGDTVRIRMGRDGDVPAYLKVDVSERRGTVSIALTPVLEFSNQARPEALRPKTMETYVNNLTNGIASLTQQNVLADQAIAANATAASQNKQPMKTIHDQAKAAKDQNTKQIEVLTKGLAQVNKAKPAVDQFGIGATFHYQITVGAGDDATVLAFTPKAEKKQHTPAPEPPKERRGSKADKTEAPEEAEPAAPEAATPATPPAG